MITRRTSGTKGKGLIRSANRASTSSKKVQPVEARIGRLAEPSACERCGSVFSKRMWRRGRVTAAVLETVRWTICPACEQARANVGFGRLLLRGSYVGDHEDAIRRRIANVAARGARTQPERRISSIDRDGDALEVITTSQKLAHRIARELEKAFGGRATYAWSDDGTLFATWRR